MTPSGAVRLSSGALLVYFRVGDMLFLVGPRRGVDRSWDDVVDSCDRVEVIASRPLSTIRFYDDGGKEIREIVSFPVAEHDLESLELIDGCRWAVCANADHVSVDSASANLEVVSDRDPVPVSWEALRAA